MCRKCDARIAESQRVAREAVRSSAQNFLLMLEKYAYDPKELDVSEVDEWIRKLADTCMKVVSAETLTELLMSIEPHGDSGSTSH